MINPCRCWTHEGGTLKDSGWWSRRTDRDGSQLGMGSGAASGMSPGGWTVHLLFSVNSGDRLSLHALTLTLKIT